MNIGTFLSFAFLGQLLHNNCKNCENNSIATDSGVKNIVNLDHIHNIFQFKRVLKKAFCIVMQKIIKFTRASEVHMHNTRYSSEGNHYNPYARTTRYGLKSLQIEDGKL